MKTPFALRAFKLIFRDAVEFFENKAFWKGYDKARDEKYLPQKFPLSLHRTSNKLFIGGCADGMRIKTGKGIVQMNIPKIDKKMSVRKTDEIFPLGLEMDHQMDTYLLRKIVSGEKFFLVMVHKELSLDNMIKMLIDNYKKCPKCLDNL